MNQETRNRLGRVLGPADPEVTCEVCFEELDRFVELELAGEDAEAAVPGGVIDTHAHLDMCEDAEAAVPGMTAHLAGCPACAEDRASLRALLEAGA